MVSEKTEYCPRCGSARLRWASGLPQLWSVCECKDCGYRGGLVVRGEKLAKKVRQRWLARTRKPKRAKKARPAKKTRAKRKA